MALPNLKEVEWAIAELEGQESSKTGYVLLSALYTVRDHMVEPTSPVQVANGYSRSAGPDVLGRYGDSEFLQALQGKGSAAVCAVMDELMETLQVVEPRVYRSVMRKIMNL